MLLRDQTKRGGLGKTYKLLSEAGHEAASVTRPTVRARGMPRASESSIGESEVKHLKGTCHLEARTHAFTYFSHVFNRILTLGRMK
jgi:hypothetical protein